MSLPFNDWSIIGSYVLETMEVGLCTIVNEMLFGKFEKWNHFVLLNAKHSVTTAPHYTTEYYLLKQADSA